MFRTYLSKQLIPVRSFINIVLSHFLERLSAATRLDLSPIFNRRLGILQHGSLEESGEAFFVKNILAHIIGGKPNAIIYDVGANEGDYAQLVLTSIPSCRIYCFEPNPPTAKRLIARFDKDRAISVHSVGIGKQSGEVMLYDYADCDGTYFASVYRDALLAQSPTAAIREVSIPVITLDEFSARYSTSAIDLLKLDTEGYEYAALQGAKKLISEKRIRCIHFEFNEMNILSRVFLRDFYELLIDYDFFRLRSDGLISLGPYCAKNEIFQYQNIVAVKKSMSELISNFTLRSVW
jgi:FkbM family methyltransferase